jgi:L-lysine exporter family protein LysE/ArgO
LGELELLGPALKGFGLGAGLIIAIGAQNAYVLRQGIRREHVLEHVLLIATICFLCDATLISIGAAGFGYLVSGVPSLERIAALGGAAFLAAYGLRAFYSALKPGSLDAGNDGTETPQAGSVWAAAGVTLALSLLNPHVYLDTVVLLGSIAGQFEGIQRMWFAVGAVIASAVWFYGLGLGARWLAPLFRKPTAWRVLDLLIGCVMWAIAASLVLPEFT